MNKRIIFLLVILFIVSFVCFIVFDKSTQKANALINITQQISGLAWSDNIGWIDFVQSVSWGETGHYGFLQGWAWSDNIGWIQLNPNAPRLDISGVANFKDDDGNGIGDFTGWIRACAGAENIDCSGLNANSLSGGWDGWIKMDGVSVDLETGKFSGFAWGSDVVGWISFSRKDCDINQNGTFEGVSEGAPTGCPSSGIAYDYFVKKDVIDNLPINLEANDTTGSITINSGDTADISWSLAPEDATKCYPLSGEDNWQSQIININNQLPSGIYTTPPLFSSITYQLKCVGIFGWGIESVNINITQPPGFSLSLSTSTIKAIIFGKTLSANSGTTTITVNSIGEYNGQVLLWVIAGKPSGSTEIFNPPFSISPPDYTKSGNIPVNGKADFSLLNVPKGANGVVTIHGEDASISTIQSDIDIYFKAINYDPNIIEK